MIYVLFVSKNSIYKTYRDVDAWDIDRNALLYKGKNPIICHPPCERWSVQNALVLLNHNNNPKYAWGNDGGTFAFALQKVRENKGILEHPHRSLAWKHFNLPIDYQIDSFGGYTIQIKQKHYGFPLEKKTLLYVVGIERKKLLPYRKKVSFLQISCGSMSSEQRSATVRPLADWLLDNIRVNIQGLSDESPKSY